MARKKSLVTKPEEELLLALLFATDNGRKSVSIKELLKAANHTRPTPLSEVEVRKRVVLLTDKKYAQHFLPEDLFQITQAGRFVILHSNTSKKDLE